jgi:glutamate dehydrogenase (NAD) (EC 1.4.1.2)
MTDEVAGLVLGNNYKQTQALSLAARRARERIAEYKRLMADLKAVASWTAPSSSCRPRSSWPSAWPQARA